MIPRDIYYPLEVSNTSIGCAGLRQRLYVLAHVKHCSNHLGFVLRLLVTPYRLQPSYMSRQRAVAFRVRYHGQQHTRSSRVDPTSVCLMSSAIPSPTGGEYDLPRSRLVLRLAAPCGLP